jgi:IclR family acetate operon transcriptional repressor
MPGTKGLRRRRGTRAKAGRPPAKRARAGRRRPARDTHIIQSLDKGLQVLELVEGAESPISLNELYRKLRWERATIHRMLETFVRRGYLTREPSTRRYSLGPRIHGLHASLRRRTDLRAVARPLLQDLSASTGESACLAIALDKAALVVEAWPGSEAITANIRVGERLPCHCTAAGKALLAYDADARARLSRRLRRYTARTVSTARGLAEDLDRIRRRGYAVEDEEHVPGVRSVAAPIFGDFGLVAAGIGLCGPKQRLSRARMRQLGLLVQEAAARVSRACGYTGPKCRE